MDTLLLGFVTFLVVILLVAVVFLLFRKPRGTADLATPLQHLTHAVQQVQAQSAVLAEKLVHLEPMTNSVNHIQVEMRGLSERISKVETNQVQAGQNIVALGTGLAQSSTTTKSLVAATNAAHAVLSHTREDLARLQTQAKERHELERQTAGSIKRLEAIIAGVQTKGVAGENILEVVFSKLPPEWQVRNFRVGNRTVEFGLRLPNHLILPIDSKWAATSLLEQFLTIDDLAEQQKLKTQIERVVLSKAKEVRKYIDPNLTVNFGIAAVPDAVYDLCSGVQADVFKLNVVLISYSMFVPYLLLVFQTILKTSQNIDLQKLDTYLQSVQDSIEALQAELEGRFSRAIKMLSNSRDDMSMHLSKANSGLASLHISTGSPSPIAQIESD